MPEVSWVELRDLSWRSRRSSFWGTLVVVAALVSVPALMVVWRAWPALSGPAAVATVTVLGVLFVRFAHVAGQARGAFRRVFRSARRS